MRRCLVLRKLAEIMRARFGTKPSARSWPGQTRRRRGSRWRRCTRRSTRPRRSPRERRRTRRRWGRTRSDGSSQRGRVGELAPGELASRRPARRAGGRRRARGARRPTRSAAESVPNLRSCREPARPGAIEAVALVGVAGRAAREEEGESRSRRPARLPSRRRALRSRPRASSDRKARRRATSTSRGGGGAPTPRCGERRDGVEGRSHGAGERGVDRESSPRGAPDAARGREGLAVEELEGDGERARDALVSGAGEGLGPPLRHDAVDAPVAGDLAGRPRRCAPRRARAGSRGARGSPRATRSTRGETASGGAAPSRAPGAKKCGSSTKAHTTSPVAIAAARGA